MNATFNKLLVVPSEASTIDTSSLWMILILCLFFCLAIRHLNDFYAGESITLVEEGTWGGRFRHKQEYRYLRHVEKDFAHMIEELQKTDQRVGWGKSGRHIGYDDEDEVDTDTDS